MSTTSQPHTNSEAEAYGVDDEVLVVDSLSVHFRQRRRVPWRAEPDVVAVKDADLRIRHGETLGLVGESGSGKSTTARAILRLADIAAGQVNAAGFDVAGFGRKTPRGFRKAVQAVFQDPQASLDSTKLIKDIIAEPLQIHFEYDKAETRRRVNELLERVGLAAHHGERYPYQLSGGQRQRIAIARAIAVEPELIILDEPVSALDVSVQSQVVNLLEELQHEIGVAYLFVAHDLAVVRHASDNIAVMYRSRIVETGPADRVCDHPAHPYTEALLAAVPDPDPRRQAIQRAKRRELRVTGDPASSGTSDGCPFAARCPHVMDRCWETFPQWTDVPAGGQVACHLYTEPSSVTGGSSDAGVADVAGGR